MCRSYVDRLNCAPVRSVRSTPFFSASALAGNPAAAAAPCRGTRCAAPRAACRRPSAAAAPPGATEGHGGGGAGEGDEMLRKWGGNMGKS